MAKGAPASSVVALGMFDGMHPGHIAVIERAVSEARARNMRSLVYTFLENPRALFAEAPLEIMPPAQRRDIMLARGIDEVVMANFTRALADMPPERFVHMLSRDYAMRAVVVGEDYTFGAGARGDVNTLMKLGHDIACDVIIVPTVMSVTETGEAGEKVSSSRIRRAILENRLDDARALMNGTPVKSREN